MMIWRVDRWTVQPGTCHLLTVFYRFRSPSPPIYYIMFDAVRVTICQNKPIDIISRSKTVNKWRVDSSERFAVHPTVHPS